MEKMNLENIGAGILVDGFERELKKVIANIDDPNTDAGKVRKIVLEVKFKPEKEDRTRIAISVQAKSTLAPAAVYESVVFMGPDERTGELVMVEPTQGTLFSAEDDGSTVVSVDDEGKVVNLR